MIFGFVCVQMQAFLSRAVNEFVQQLTRGDLNSKEKFAQLKEAYDVLSDSSSRNEYNQKLGLVTKGSAPSLQMYVRLVIIIFFHFQS